MEAGSHGELGSMAKVRLLLLLVCQGLLDETAL
jgi:hypothetical protein